MLLDQKGTELAAKPGNMEMNKKVKKPLVKSHSEISGGPVNPKGANEEEKEASDPKKAPKEANKGPNSGGQNKKRNRQKYQE